MTKYHYNPATGKSGPCRADAKECPLLSQYADGQVAHFETKRECEAFGEKVLAAQYEFEMKRTLQKKEQEYATAQLAYDLSQNQHTLVDDVAHNDDATDDEQEFARINAEQEKNPMGIFPKELAGDVLFNSNAVFLTKKPTDETYENIAAYNYLKIFRFASWDDNDVNTTVPFDIEGGQSNVPRWAAQHSGVVGQEISNSMKPLYEQSELKDNIPLYLTDVDSESSYARSFYHIDEPSEDDLAEAQRQAQEIVKAVTTSDTIPDVEFENDVDSAVDNTSFTRYTSRDFTQALMYTRESSSFAKKLTVHENNAIAFWTGTGSEFVNEKVYKNIDKTSYSKSFDTDTYVKTLNSAIHRSDASEKVVFRGINHHTASSVLNKEYEEYNDRAKVGRDYYNHVSVGEKMTFKTPQSTTTKGHTATGFANSNVIYVIKSKTNAPVGSISAYGIDEEEYLIPSDVEYKIVGKTSRTIKKSSYGGPEEMFFIQMEEV